MNTNTLPATEAFPLIPRAKGGQFAPGNQAANGRANPAAAHAKAIKQAFMDAVRPEDVSEIIQTLVRQAKGGDIYSAKLILDRVAPQKVFEEAANEVAGAPAKRVDMSRLTLEQVEALAAIEIEED